MKRRLLIIGCGDVALRAAPLLARRFRLIALSHTPERFPLLRSRGITPLAGDLDIPRSLQRIAGLAHAVVHLAPPPGSGEGDPRTARLLAALGKGRMVPQHLVYISTSGVYGDCQGARVPETRPVRPVTARGRRRVDAERRVRIWGRRVGAATAILRVPGIYGPGRLPLERVRSRTPVIAAPEDGFTNHVHADDLARMVAAALFRGRGGRCYNASDDSELKMGDYFDLVADCFGLPRPPRVSRSDAARTIPPSLLSFMGESRRLVNRRMKRELRVRLRFPTVAEGVAAAARAGPDCG